MKSLLFEDVRDKIEHAKGLYHRLVLVVGPAGTGKSAALREVSEGTGAPLVNTNLELSRRLLDLAARQRPLRIQRFLEETIAEHTSDVVLLDNTELLFDITLCQDPLRLLQGLSRSRTVFTSWNGTIEDGRLCYAEPGHREYRRYRVDGILVANAEAAR